ncbi:hypothetical protein VJ923_07880 [Adlercreutzia sp. R25]|uniref:hypothetical protein n=1 Tax=Adlercreutzia shanghongiae TaxID=3111773 RepID=UPI002DBBA6D2|nr:hypothetical protein [Adlercreutzia sp. R25]MEC4273075.1 hypothetical protein [Adlercreutzia sp. R25]
MNENLVLRERAARIDAGRRLFALVAASFAALLSVALVLASVPAYAAGAEGSDDEGALGGLTVTGVDFMQPKAEAWEVLRVDGAQDGDIIYLSLTERQGGDRKVLAYRQAYRLQDAAFDSSVGDVPLAHIVAFSLPAGASGEAATPLDAFGEGAASSLSGKTFALSVYATSVQTADDEALFEGTVYPVYAKLLDENGEVESYRLMGIRVLEGAPAECVQSVGAGKAFYRGTGDDLATYSLVMPSDGSKADNAFDEHNQAFIVTYQRALAGSVSGTITYVDSAGVTVRTDSVPAINQADENGQIGKIVSPESSFFGDGAYYRVIGKLYGEVRLTPAYANHVVRVMEVDNMTAKAYQVTVRYVTEVAGESGEPEEQLLWSDTLDVKGEGYRYTLPTVFSANASSGVNYYTFLGASGAQGGIGALSPALARSGTSAVIAFDENVNPETDFYKENGRYYLKAHYQSQDANKTAALKIVEVDGSQNKTIGEWKGEITPDKDAVYTPANKVIEGVTYVPWSGNADVITYTWEDMKQGADLLQYVYYVPEDYVPGSAYDITVQYLNIANSQVVRTETLTVDPEMTDYLAIVGEERFSSDGIEYVRLAGQESGIRHTYFTPQRTYAIYYRDVNDTINADTVIRRTQIIETERVVEVPGEATFTTTVTAAPAVAPAAGDAAAGAGVPAVDAGVGAGDGAVVINDDENPLANAEGVDTATERTVEENENPLASGAADSERAAFGGSAIAVGTLIAALAAVAFAAYLLLGRRKKNESAAVAATETDELNE